MAERQIPHAIMFHHFERDAGGGGQGALRAPQLRAILDQYGRDRLLHAREFADRAREDRLEPQHACLSFDDGLRCQFEIALPVLRELDLTAFWFIPTAAVEDGPRYGRLEIFRQFRTSAFSSVDAFYSAFDEALGESPFAEVAQRALARYDHADYRQFPFYSEADSRFRFVRDHALGPDRYDELMEQMIEAAGLQINTLASGLWLDKDQLAALQGEGHELGLHSHTHPTLLAALDVESQRREYELNRDALASMTSATPTSCAHPCNSYTAQTLDVLRELGVDLGFCSNMTRAGPTQLEMPREDSANLLRGLRP